MSAVYAVIYFVLLFTLVFGSSYIPRCGLTKAFVDSTNYVRINMAAGDLSDMPHVFMCFGVMYYLILIEIYFEIHSVKVSLVSFCYCLVGSDLPICGNGAIKRFVINDIYNVIKIICLTQVVSHRIFVKKVKQRILVVYLSNIKEIIYKTLKRMNKNNMLKLSYIPPRVEVTRVVLETVIAASPVQKVNLKDWDYEDEDVSGNSADIRLYF